MAHCLLLFVGTHQNLQDIYDGCPDSSSESAAEMAFGADYIDEFDKSWGSGEFTKDTKETKGTCHLNYSDVVSGNWYDCYDIRDPNHYGDFGWINIPEQMEEMVDDAFDWRGRIKRNNAKVIEALKNLPDDTVFFFADSHW